MLHHYIITTEDYTQDAPVITRNHYLAMSLLHVIDMHLGSLEPEHPTNEEHYIQFSVKAERGPRLKVTVSTYHDPADGTAQLIIRVEA